MKVTAVQFAKATGLPISISDFRLCTYEIIALLGFNPACIATLSPTLRDNLSVPSSRVKQSKLGCPETSVINHQYMLRKIPEGTMPAWNHYLHYLFYNCTPKHNLLCKNWGYHSGRPTAEVSSFLRCDFVRLGQCFSTFRRIIVSSFLLPRVPPRMIGLLNAAVWRHYDGSKRRELLVQPHVVVSQNAWKFYILIWLYFWIYLTFKEVQGRVHLLKYFTVKK